MNVSRWLTSSSKAHVTLPELVAALSVDAVVAAVESGELHVDEAIAAERQGRARADLLAALGRR